MPRLPFWRNESDHAQRTKQANTGSGLASEHTAHAKLPSTTRPLRLEFAGALYHVTARGDQREPIFEDDDDRRSFVEILGALIEDFHWAAHAYCLMGNHNHLLEETPNANLANCMRQLNGIYTQRSNRRHGRVGHLFQGRYKAIMVARGTG